MVSEARRQKIALKRQARNRERNARAAIIAEQVFERQYNPQNPLGTPSSSSSPFSDKEDQSIDKRQLMAVARKQAREDLRTEKRARKLQQLPLPRSPLSPSTTPHDTSRPAKPSTFLQLPAEVRGLVYEHVFADRKLPITAAGSADTEATPGQYHARHRPGHPLRNLYALTSVCRLIRHDVLPLLPRIWDLRIEWRGSAGRAGATAFREWFRRCGFHRVSQIRDMWMEVEGPCAQGDADADGRRRPCVRYAHIWADGPLPTDGGPPVWRYVYDACSNGSRDCEGLRARKIEVALAEASKGGLFRERPHHPRCGQIYAALSDGRWSPVDELSWPW